MRHYYSHRYYQPDHTHVNTGDAYDPGYYAVLPLINAANIVAWRVDRAKYDLIALPKLTSPTNYATARNAAAALQPSALQTVAAANAFVAAVAAAKALAP